MKWEQLNDDIISEAKEIVLGNGRVKRGRLKRVKNQLQIENDILTKVGRPIISPLLRIYVLKAIHNIARFGIDKTYALPIDDSGYRYILMIGDMFSKYVEIVPLQNQHAVAISDAILENWIFPHGCPSYMVSDQASNVDGDLLQSVCSTLDIRKRRSSACHPRGNGFAERNIKSEGNFTLFINRLTHAAEIMAPGNYWFIICIKC